MSLCGCNCADTMADVNVNAPAEQAPAMAPPTRTDDQILPRSSWVPVGKSNCYLDVEKSQSNPIYKIAVDILKHTNFFRAFTASSTIPSIYIQQFWDTIRYDKTTGRYSCQLDEQWFDLNKDTLRDALQITPVNNNQPFSSPPTPMLFNFVNDLGSLKERMWEEFTQSIHSFVEDKKNLVLHTPGKKKADPIVIPSIRFTKLIIHHLQSKHKFHPRPGSPLHLPYEEYVLGYLKFSAKGTKHEVFGMPIPNDLITADIRDGQYYNEYLEKVAKHQRYLSGEEGSDPDSLAPKPAKATKPEANKKSKPLAPKAAPVIKPAAAKASKSTSSQQPKPKPAPVKPQEKKRKLVTETPDEPSLAKSSKRGLVSKKRKPTSSLRLVDEYVDEGVPENDPRFDDEEANMQRAVEESLKDVHATHRGLLPPVVFREPDSGRCQPLPETHHCNAEPKLGPSIHHQDEKATLADVETDTEELLIPIENSGEEVSNTEVLGTESGRQDDKQGGPDPRTLSSLQHLAKDFSFGDQFFNDKPSDAENEKTTAETKAESMVSITIHQDTSAIPLMTSPVIDLISRPDSPNEHQPLPATTTATATTTTATTTITTLPLPPQPQQSTTDSILITRIGELEQIMANLIQDNEHLKESLDSHGSRLYKLENLNISYQVSKAVDEIVTDAVDWVIQAPLKDRFRDLPEADMKEILYQRM
ncbi:hypothetical protein Tco_0394760 [Tanacetum coccineum]